MDLIQCIKRRKSKVSHVSTCSDYCILGYKNGDIVVVDFVNNTRRIFTGFPPTAHIKTCDKVAVLNFNDKSMAKFHKDSSTVEKIKVKIIVLDSVCTVDKESILCLTQSNKLYESSADQFKLVCSNMSNYPTNIYQTSNLLYLYNRHTQMLLLLDPETFDPIKELKNPHSDLCLRGVNYFNGDMCFQNKDRDCVLMSNTFKFFAPDAVKKIKYDVCGKLYCCTRNMFMVDGVTVYKHVEDDPIVTFDVCDGLCILVTSHSFFIFKLRE